MTTVGAEHDSPGDAPVLTFGAQTVPEPALRHRIEDVHDIVALLLRQLSRGADLGRCGHGTGHLTRHDLPQARVRVIAIRVCDDAEMTAVPAHFTRSNEDTFLPTATAQSRWGDDHLNGPALVGLAAWTLEEQFGLDGFMPARLTVDLFKAARGVPMVVSMRLIRDGRRVRNCECELLQDGVAVVRATLVQYRSSAAPEGEEWIAPMTFPYPAVDETQYMRIGSDQGGWSDAIADQQNTSRKRFVNRSVDVVQGQRNGSFVDAAMLAEGTSLVTNLGSAGIGYINGDLTVGLARLPHDEWIGVQADSHWVNDGIAVGTATLFDSVGPFGSGMVTAVSNPAAQIDFTNDRFPERTR